MGKRNKNRDMTAASMVEITESNTENQEKVVQEEKKNKRKKNKPSMSSDIDATDKSKKTIDINQALTTEDINSEKRYENYKQTSTHKNKKKKRETEMVEEKPQKVMNSSHESSEISKESVDKQANAIPKQIKFGEDGEPESDILKNTKEQSFLNDEEKAIQDDDIDQFCNDIDDEDNKQYESWISLLEQKLGSSDNNSSNKKNKRKRKKQIKILNSRGFYYKIS
ncbi:unnamed protein product [Pieris macdunnoughi]|uniref:Uncharacterized protein n=1 Tax=Pieris macdunnoughi TaxID=345717 RepID=A0A821TPR1_9NEOP|nr:unnamed protein product [Pieris macdunnoughi]